MVPEPVPDAVLAAVGDMMQQVALIGSADEAERDAMYDQLAAMLAAAGMEGAASPATTQAAPATPGDSAASIDPISLECERLALMLQLRKSFEREVVTAMGIPPCNEMLNAWLFVQLARSHAAGLVTDEFLFVPLQPLSDGLDATSPLAKYVTRMVARDQAAAAQRAANAADASTSSSAPASSASTVASASASSTMPEALLQSCVPLRQVIFDPNAFKAAAVAVTGTCVLLDDDRMDISQDGAKLIVALGPELDDASRQLVTGGGSGSPALVGSRVVVRGKVKKQQRRTFLVAERVALISAPEEREQQQTQAQAANVTDGTPPSDATASSTLQNLDVAAVATRLDGWLRGQWDETRRLLATRTTTRGEGASAAAPPVVRSSAKEDGSAYTVRLEPPPRGQQSSHTINGRTLAKLRRGCVGDAAGDAGDAGDAGAAGDDAASQFDASLWRLLHRYSAFFGPHAGEGAGWQLATPPAAMERLTTDLGAPRPRHSR